MWWIIIVLCILAVLILYTGYHLRMINQFRKKQEADAALFYNVINNLNERLSTEEALKRFHILEHAQLLSFVQQKTRYPLTQNDRLRVLVNGEETYSKLFQAIKKAEHHVHLLYYTIRHDEVGKELLRLLMKKAQEGVIVRVLVDGVGSMSFSEKTIKKLERYGIECAIFAPPKLTFILHINYRNHRKIAVIDGKVAFTGGLNIGDEYLHKDPKKGYWRDIHLLVEGESVLLLQRIFATDWYYVKNQKIEEDEHYFPTFHDKTTFKQPTSQRPIQEKTVLAQVLPSGPDMGRRVIRDVYRQMILSAQKRVWLATPYFIPDKGIMTALGEAIDRGVKVTLLVPFETDNWFVQHASFHYYQRLIRKGAQIYLYRKGFYHAKIALVDDQIATIGSANLDQRSFYFSFEAGLLIYDPTVCHKVKQLFLEDFEDSQQLLADALGRRSLLQKTATSFSLLLSPWL